MFDCICLRSACAGWLPVCCRCRVRLSQGSAQRISQGSALPGWRFEAASLRIGLLERNRPIRCRRLETLAMPRPCRSWQGPLPSQVPPSGPSQSGGQREVTAERGCCEPAKCRSPGSARSTSSSMAFSIDRQRLRTPTSSNANAFDRQSRRSPTPLIANAFNHQRLRTPTSSIHPRLRSSAVVTAVGEAGRSLGPPRAIPVVSSWA